MNLYCTIVCPLTQIWHLESTLLCHIRKGKDGSNEQGKLIKKKKKILIWFVRENKNGNLVPDPYKKAIKSKSYSMLIGD